MPHLSGPLAKRAMPWLLAAALASGVAVARAEPDAGNDPVSRFLIQKGLVEPSTSPSEPGSTFVGRMRETASDMVITAMNFLGVRYRRGGNSAEEGFDCSGFTRHIFEKSLGLVLPRRADEQANAPGLVTIRREELKPGDLVFFNTLRRTFSHVGIYVGEGKFIHAPRSGTSVRVEDMRFAYWAKRFTGARRAGTAGDADASAPTPLPALPTAATEATFAPMR